MAAATTAVITAAATPVGASAGQTVTSLRDGLTASSLAQTLVGDGVAISNTTYTGSDLAAGRFSGFASATGIGSGVALSSGSVVTKADDEDADDEDADGGSFNSSIEGPNTSDENDGDFDTPGDADLDSLISPDSTNDASVLQFDFVPQGNRLAFDYVFGSDEYNEYVNEYNDVFAFYVNGHNCAVVGNDHKPVSIDTINKEVNSPLYRNNDPSDFATPPLDTELDGLTTVLSCEAPVNPGVTNHLKLAIADARDTSLDSSVLIRARSIEAADPPTAVDDSYSTATNTALSIAAPGVLGNDTDPQNRPLTVSPADVTQPSHGSVAVAGNGSFTFTPADGYSGPDSFTYKASNGVATSTKGATVSVQVTAPGAATPPSVDKIALGYRADGAGEVTTNSAGTNGSGELVLAYVQADGPAGTRQAVKSVSGGGLTWKRTAYVDQADGGANEVWQAFSTSANHKFKVTAQFKLPADGALSVISYRHAAATLGAVHATTQISGTAVNKITPTRSGSLIGVSGLNLTSTVKPAPAAGQNLVTYVLDKNAIDTYWTQAVNGPTVAGTPVAVQAGVRAGDRWSLVTVEVRPAA